MFVTLLHEIKIKLIVEWYDLWIGVYIDVKKRRVYILPFPCVGLVIHLGPEWVAGHLSNGCPARQHWWSKECQIETHTGYWYPAHTDHWNGFKKRNDEGSTKVCDTAS